MRVGLTGAGAGGVVTVRLLAPVKVIDAETEQSLQTVPAGSWLTFRARGGGLNCEAPPLRASGFRLRSDRQPAFELRGRTYGGTLELWAGRRRPITVIDEVELEDYVRGVLSVEGSPSLHLEARKALAVAARTYALYNWNRHESEGFSVCNTTHCQGFGGWADEPWCREPVDATRGEILAGDRGPFPAVYCTDCGGVTASGAEAGLGRDADALVSVLDAPGPGAPPYCAVDRDHRWELDYRLNDLGERLQAAGLISGHLVGLRLTPTDGPNRSARVVLEEAGPSRRPASQSASSADPKRREKTVSLPALRHALGADRFRSTLVSVETLADGRIAFHGRGWGHGAGLCLWGAEGMARPPFNCGYRAILQHYYPRARLTEREGDWVACEPNSHEE